MNIADILLDVGNPVPDGTFCVFVERFSQRLCYDAEDHRLKITHDAR